MRVRPLPLAEEDKNEDGKREKDYDKGEEKRGGEEKKGRKTSTKSRKNNSWMENKFVEGTEEE